MGLRQNASPSTINRLHDGRLEIEPNGVKLAKDGSQIEIRPRRLVISRQDPCHKGMAVTSSNLNEPVGSAQKKPRRAERTLATSAGGLGSAADRSQPLGMTSWKRNGGKAYVARAIIKTGVAGA
jgi:hypothetical protein